MSDRKVQGDKFREAARELGTDDDENHFDSQLKGILKQPPPVKDGDTSKKKPGH